MNRPGSQMSRHVAMFPHFYLTGALRSLSGVRKSVQREKNHIFCRRNRFQSRENCKNYRKNLRSRPLFLAQTSQFGRLRANVMCASPVVWQMSRHDATSCSCHQISRQMSRHVEDTTQHRIEANVEKKVATLEARGNCRRLRSSLPY